VALKDVIGSRGRSQVTWLACGTVSFHAAFRQVGRAWFGADTTRRRRVRRDRKSLQVRKQEAERRMVADCDCGLGLHGTLMRGGMERIGGIGGLGLISGKT
jgi:hypothetical protein